MGSAGWSGSPLLTKPARVERSRELYNLEDDPREERNLWLEKPETVARLTALLKKYQTDGRSR